MKSLWRLLVVAVLLLLIVRVGNVLLSVYSGVVTSHYATKLDAEKDQLFGRGWLPNFIPDSSRDIVTRNDLDLNTSNGGFYCKPEELAAFVQRLKPYTAGDVTLARFADEVTRMKARGYVAYYFRDQKDGWVFFVDSVKGHVEYSSWMEQ